MATIRLVVAEEGLFFRQAGRELTPEGMFVPTAQLLPIGSEVTIQLEDAAAVRLFAAKGKVVGSRAAQSVTREPPGMLVKFFALAPGSRDWLESRRAQYLEVEVGEISLDDLAPSVEDTKPSPPAVPAPVVAVPPTPPPAPMAPPAPPAEAAVDPWAAFSVAPPTAAPPPAPRHAASPSPVERVEPTPLPIVPSVVPAAPVPPASRVTPLSALAAAIDEAIGPSSEPLPDPPPFLPSPEPAPNPWSSGSVPPSLPDPWAAIGASPVSVAAPAPDPAAAPAFAAAPDPAPAPVPVPDPTSVAAPDPAPAPALEPALETAPAPALEPAPAPALETAPAPAPEPAAIAAPDPAPIDTPSAEAPSPPGESAPPLAASPAPARARAPRLRQSEKIVGIDLGTTFTCAAVVINGEPQVIPSPGGYRTFPSVVTMTSDGELVGWASLDRLATFPKQTVYGSKRLLGRNFHSQPVQDALAYFDYKIVSGDDGETAVNLEGSVYSMIWVSARILEQVREAACAHVGEDVTKAVITVPAYYGDRQRQAVVEAGRQAGLEVVQIVNEPTAAAVAYGVNRSFDQRVLVYDLGGGTFDVSILEIHGNLFEVLATGGDPYLGGVDFDHRIVDFCLQETKKRTGEELSGDPVLKLRLRQVAENAKRELSTQNETRIYLPNARGGATPIAVDVTLTRDRLNRLVADMVDRTIEICRKTLVDARLKAEDLNELVFVGGQTRMPLVGGKVHSFSGKQPRKGLHPDEAVAIGAALLGFSRDKIDAPTLVDVISQPIGVGLPGGRFKEIVARQSQLPLTRDLTRLTTQDDQTSIVLDVYQGEHDRVDKNDFLGTVRLVGLPPRPKGQVSVKIQFRLDAQGLLTISGVDSVTGRSQVVSLATKDTPETLKEALDAARAEAATAAKEKEDAPDPSQKSPKKGLLRRLLGG